MGQNEDERIEELERKVAELEALVGVKGDEEPPAEEPPAQPEE